jgi:hypothetical protein
MASPTPARLTPSTAPRHLRPGRRLLPLLALAAFLPACATFAEYDSSQDLGLGVRGQVPLTRIISPEGSVSGSTASRLEIAGSLHRFTPGESTLVVASSDLVLPLFRLADGQARTYVGGGAHLGRVSPPSGDTSTEAGLNLMGGVRFERRAFAPFFEVRGGVGGYSELSAVLGVRLFGAGN